ncbi:hypothetical protein PVAP13_4NG164277 [Panicum virgatum]|uniref:Uncharacterized protein n=1 Tax=Panicum virgatum TaxID=38727 RepID=A0A8T0T560_PANVG|nr:hypothetical protein PVAP13_4NG164277 [Panicum virgatum]
MPCRHGTSPVCACALLRYDALLRSACTPALALSADVKTVSWSNFVRLYHPILAGSVRTTCLRPTPTASAKISPPSYLSIPCFSILSVLPQQSKTITIFLICFFLSLFSSGSFTSPA